MSMGMVDKSLALINSETEASGDAETNTDNKALIPPEISKAVETLIMWQIMSSRAKKIVHPIT